MLSDPYALVGEMSLLDQPVVSIAASVPLWRGERQCTRTLCCTVILYGSESSNLSFELRALGKKIVQRHRPVTLTLAISCTKLQAKFARDNFLKHLEFCHCLKDASHKTWDLVPKESTSHTYDMLLLRIPLTSAGGLKFPMTLTTHNGADRLPNSARRYLNPKDGYLETTLAQKMQLNPHTILQQMRLTSALRLKMIILVLVPNLEALNRMAKQLDWTCFKMSLDA